ncbi:MAG: type II toxin-antitoxin system VapC family toxin [Alphaproteobacteria bacterium]|nr:type II toxin-antitoxin system VapC family toxin [Alphaproteobacteria bacterium]
MVLDASGVVELLLGTDSGKRLDARLRVETEGVHVPHLIDAEIAQALRRLVLRGLLDARSGALALRRWREFDVERYPHGPLLDRVWELRANATAYDATYLALAETLSMVFVTGDRRLAGVPGVRTAIEVL